VRSTSDNVADSTLGDGEAQDAINSATTVQFVDDFSVQVSPLPHLERCIRMGKVSWASNLRIGFSLERTSLQIQY
jgi:hypothetical protein